MKKILSVDTTTKTAGIALLAGRIGIAFLMLSHGIPKLMLLFPGAPLQFPPVMGMSAGLSLTLTVFAEVVCSIFILAGFATRLATVPLIITMLVAIIVVHGADPFTRQEPALHYLLVYVVLLIAGSGKYSVDYIVQSKNLAARYNQAPNAPALSIINRQFNTAEMDKIFKCAASLENTGIHVAWIGMVIVLLQAGW